MSQSITKSLRFVRGAFEEGHFIPAFRNFAIRDRLIQGADGIVTLCAGIDIDLDICVDAGRFARAVVACDQAEDIDIEQTNGGNLKVSAGPFRAYVPVDPSPKEFPWTEPDGESYDVPIGFLEALKACKPFIGQDATRPWSQGVLIDSGNLYTTNNVVLIRAPLGDKAWDDFRGVVIPVRAVDELLRIGQPPKRILVDDGAVTFMYARTWWLKTQRIAAEWPDIAAMFAKAAAAGSKPQRITPEFYQAFQRLRTFVPGTSPMYVKDGCLTTELTDGAGALIEGFDKTVTCGFMTDMMRLVLEVATHIDLKRYPDAYTFVGKHVSGLFAAYRMNAQGPAPTQPVRPDVEAENKAVLDRAKAKAAAKKAK